MDIKQTWLCKQPIAHRGLHNDEIPENSLKAFENAVNNNYPIELDVRIIDDGTIIVFHDDKLARMTSMDGYACSLKKNDLVNYHLANSDQTIPTFEQVLETVNGKTPILVEIKNEGRAGELERKTMEMLKAYNGEIAIESFDPFSLEYFKNNAPDFTRGILASFMENAPLAWYKKFALKRLMLNNLAKPDFVAYDHVNLPNKYVTKTKLPVIAWTIRSNSEMEKVLPHCDNFIFEGFTPKFDEKQ